MNRQEVFLQRYWGSPQHPLCLKCFWTKWKWVDLSSCLYINNSLCCQGKTWCWQRSLHTIRWYHFPFFVHFWHSSRKIVKNSIFMFGLPAQLNRKICWHQSMSKIFWGVVKCKDDPISVNAFSKILLHCYSMNTHVKAESKYMNQGHSNILNLPVILQHVVDLKQQYDTVGLYNKVDSL